MAQSQNYFGWPFFLVVWMSIGLILFVCSLGVEPEGLGGCICWMALSVPVVSVSLFNIFFSKTVRFRRRANRIHRQLCIRCGYDLRASDEACPECGLHVPAPKHVVDALNAMTEPD
jgi:hypothetical protein